MSGKRILSEAQLEEMVHLRERGRGFGFIAQHFTAHGTPISAGSISWQCLRLGADVPPRMRNKCHQGTQPRMRGGHVVRPFTPVEDAQLLELEGQGKRVSDIARTLDRKENSIRGRIFTLARREARSEDL